MVLERALIEYEFGLGVPWCWGNQICCPSALCGSKQLNFEDSSQPTNGAMQRMKQWEWGPARRQQNEIYVKEGEEQRLAGDFSGAIASFNVALIIDPKDAVALRHRGEAKRQSGDFAGAIADLDLALELRPRNAFALGCRGEAKRQRGDFAGAFADLDLALELEPKKLEPKKAFALGCRGEAKRQRGDFAGAIADLDLALQLKPKDALALRCRGEAKRQRGDFAGAIADLDLALQLKPKDALALRCRGDVKRGLRHFAGAIADFNVALELDPKDAFALSRRGDAKRRLGDFPGAMADLDLAFKMEPDAFAWWCRDLVIKDLLTGLAGEQLKWAVVGAGPVGLVLAMSMAVSMLLQGQDATVARINVYETRWIEWSQAEAKWRRASFFFANFWPFFFVTIIGHRFFTWYGRLFVSVTIFVEGPAQEMEEGPGIKWWLSKMLWWTRWPRRCGLPFMARRCLLIHAMCR